MPEVRSATLHFGKTWLQKKNRFRCNVAIGRANQEKLHALVDCCMKKYRRLRYCSILVGVHMHHVIFHIVGWRLGFYTGSRGIGKHGRLTSGTEKNHTRECILELLVRKSCEATEDLWYEYGGNE